jgi:hypothetical protein
MTVQEQRKQVNMDQELRETAHKIVTVNAEAIWNNEKLGCGIHVIRLRLYRKELPF